MISDDQLVILSIIALYLLLILIKIKVLIYLPLSRFERDLTLDPLRDMLEELIFDLSERYKQLLREQLIEYSVVLFIVLIAIVLIFRLGNFIVKCLNKTILKVTILCLCVVFKIPQSIVKVIGFLYHALRRVWNISELDGYKIRLSASGLSDADSPTDGCDNRDSHYQTYFSLNNVKDMLFLDDNMNICIPISHNGKTYYRINKPHHIV